MAERPRGAEFIVSGDLKVDLYKTGGQVWDEEIAAVVVMAGLEYFAGNILLLRRSYCKDQRTWVVVRQGRVVRSRTDHILGSNRWIFQNVALRNLRHNSYHCMVLGCPGGASLREHPHYLWRRLFLLLRPPVRQTRTWADKIFADFWHTVPDPYKQAVHHNLWILAEMWRLVDKRVSTRREPGQDQRRLRRLVHAILVALKEYRRWRAATAGEEVE